MDEGPPDGGDDWRGHRYGHRYRGWERRAFPVWGLFVFVLGLAWLGGEAGWWGFSWQYAGPLAVMFAGLGMMLAWARRNQR